MSYCGIPKIPSIHNLHLKHFCRNPNLCQRLLIISGNQAEELINVGQKQDALQALHDLITSKRYRAWQKTHEKIMFKYIELCVDMRRGRFAKDDLIQYRIICQQREFEKRVVRRREAEYVRLRAEREERLSQVLKARKEERDMKRKMLYLRTEEERLTRLREEEEAQKRLGHPSFLGEGEVIVF
uniref:eIF3a PCI domain-containing protein n=1 Tax=Helianthus annuus TaxID=4232 RepID=A0A251TWF4_HELAN